MTHIAEIRDDRRLYVDGRLVEFQASACRPPTIWPQAWQGYGEVGLWIDLEHTRSLAERGQYHFHSFDITAAGAMLRKLREPGWCP